MINLTFAHGNFWICLDLGHELTEDDSWLVVSSPQGRFPGFLDLVGNQGADEIVLMLVDSTDRD